MKYSYIVFFVFFYLSSTCQTTTWKLGVSGGISGVNKVIKNNVIFDARVKFNAKNNSLNNKFRNNDLYSARLNLLRTISRGTFKNFTIDGSLVIYSFSSTYYKEDRFSVTLDLNDTINTPNWLVSKYSIPFVELSVGKKIPFKTVLDIEISAFLGYMIELYGTSNLILRDKEYAQYERHNFTFYKDYPNLEYDEINYGIRSSIKFFPNKRLHPFLTYTQSINDISRQRFYVNQHANIWSFQAGLEYNFKSKN